MPEQVPTIGIQLTSRPGRPALVAPDLGQLKGPTSGLIELPHRLVWQPKPNRQFNLDDPFDRIHVYEIVLREAIRVDELVTWLDADVLRELWPDLYLPRGVRQAWEVRHPELAKLRVAA
jgi:hypothetical protein